MSTHVYGSRWIDCMRGAEGCQSDAEHDLRDQVADLKRALEEALAQLHSCSPRGHRKALEPGEECDGCARIRAIAEGVEP